MLDVSQMGQIIPSSPIRKLVPFAEAAEGRGIKVYRLNIGQPDINTPQVALDSLKGIHDSRFPYSHSAGNISYRRKMTDYYAKVGVSVTTDDIIVTSGGSEALQMAFAVCCNPGDEIIIPEPFYANYITFAREYGINIRPIRSTIDNGFALPAIEEFEKVINPRTRAILVCNPNNPTGYLYTRSELEKLRDIVLRYDLYLIADEVYREFCYDGMEHVSVLSLEGLNRNAILIDSVSKRYSMCGVRLGALISRNGDIMAAVMKMAQARLSPPYIAQVVAEAALDTPRSYFEQVHEEYVARRNRLVGLLNSIEGVCSPMPHGAFYTMARLPVDNCDHFARWMLEEFSYRGSTVMMAPGTGFYATPNTGVDQVRLAYVLRIEDIESAMECLKEGLKEYNSR